MNQLATDFLKGRFYSGQITGEDLMRRVEAEVRREVATEIEQIRGERDETAKELASARALSAQLRAACLNVVEKAQAFRAASSWDEQAISASRYSDAYNDLNAAIDAANTVAK